MAAANQGIAYRGICPELGVPVTIKDGRCSVENCPQTRCALKEKAEAMNK